MIGSVAVRLGPSSNVSATSSLRGRAVRDAAAEPVRRSASRRRRTRANPTTASRARRGRACRPRRPCACRRSRAARRQAEARAEEGGEDRRAAEVGALGSSHAAISAMTADDAQRSAARDRASSAPATSAERDERELADAARLVADRDRDDEGDAGADRDQRRRRRRHGPRRSRRLTVVCAHPASLRFPPVGTGGRAAPVSGKLGAWQTGDRVRVGVLAPMKSELRPVVKAFGLKPGADRRRRRCTPASSATPTSSRPRPGSAPRSRRARPSGCSGSATSTA